MLTLNPKPLCECESRNPQPASVCAKPLTPKPSILSSRLRSVGLFDYDEELRAAGMGQARDGTSSGEATTSDNDGDTRT